MQTAKTYQYSYGYIQEVKDCYELVKHCKLNVSCVAHTHKASTNNTCNCAVEHVWVVCDHSNNIGGWELHS